MITEMAEVAAKLKLSNFDLLLVADGSGMRNELPCGWYCAAWDGEDWCREYVGGTSSGTNNFAELMPFITALWSYHTLLSAGGNTVPGQKVELVSDSEVTVHCGNGKYARKANGSLWASIDWFISQGYQLHWNHIPRNSVSVHEKADHEGRKIRVFFETREQQ